MTFTDLGRNVVYLPAYYVDQKIVGAGAPFALTDSGELRRLDGASDDVTIHFRVERPPKHERPSRPTIHVRPDHAYKLFVWNVEAGGWTSRGTVGEVADVPGGGVVLACARGVPSERTPFTIESPQRDVADAPQLGIVHW